MTRSATMALAPVCDEGIIRETVQILECGEVAQDTELALLCSDSSSSEVSVSETVGNLISFMPAMADQFMLSVESATRKLTDRVDDAQSLTPHEIKAAKEAFIGTMLEAAGQLISQREWLVDEIRRSDGLGQGKVFDKIKQTEALVEAEDLRIRAMTEDDSVDLSAVMRSISALNEKKAYLCGLKFQIQTRTV